MGSPRFVPRRTVAAVALIAASVGGASASAGEGLASAARAPRLSELVAFPDGSARQATVSDAQASVRVGAKRCTVPAGTALAALSRSGAGALRLRDFGLCSARAADAGGLFVAAIGHDRNSGQSGWVYKVGARLASAGSADPAGPFGSGPLRPAQHVTWFYCRMRVRTHSCQPTLGLTARALGGGAVRVTVRSYDDRGHTRAGARATVHSGTATATADRHGSVTLHLVAGRAAIYATAGGAVRSFGVGVQVR